MKEKSELEILKEQEAALQARMKFNKECLKELESRSDNPDLKQLLEKEVAADEITLNGVKDKIKAIQELSIDRMDRDTAKKDKFEGFGFNANTVSLLLHAASAYLESNDQMQQFMEMQEKAERYFTESVFKGEIASVQGEVISVEEHNRNKIDKDFMDELKDGLDKAGDRVEKDFKKPEYDAAEKWRNDIIENDKKLLADFNHDINELKLSKDMLKLSLNLSDANLNLSDANSIPDRQMRDEKMIIAEQKKMQAEQAEQVMLKDGIKNAESKLQKGIDFRDKEIVAYNNAVEKRFEAGPDLNTQNEAIENKRMEFKLEMAKQREREIEDNDSPRR